MNADIPIDSPDTSRFVVGIDLGTTNSAVSYVDTDATNWQVGTFAIPQLVAPGQIESRETLPSFHYQAIREEFPENSLSLPWDEQSRNEVVGLFAREQGKLVPGRVIESAKSWLCHPGVDRTSPLLPWHGATDVEMLSPVEVSSKYLSHIRDAWNAANPEHPLQEQDVVVTLPASFDEVARELTVQAAQSAGLKRVLLIEEPQAAFYAWINSHQGNWNELVQAGQTILVCDIGGGTSDFTLINVREHVDEKVEFHRVAVGDHLILGGDNLDLALAKHVEIKLSQDQSLSPRQWGSLVRICRHAKETLLGPNAPESYPISLSTGSSKLIGGGLQTELTQTEVRELLLSGFFPEVGLQDRPLQNRSGFQEFGLPYAADAAITRYLAAFLSNHVQPDAEQNCVTRPDVVLFNGGAFLSPLIQERIIGQLQKWFRGDDESWTPHVLENERHDLAVSRGAAYYGMVRRGAGVRIAAGLPRTYYIGVEYEDDDGVELRALTLMPAGAEPGFEAELDDFEFDLTIASPVEFPLFYSGTRLTDAPGELIKIEKEQMTSLPSIRTVLRSRKEKQAATIPVVIHAKLNEIGTLQLWCSEEGGSRSWQLQFDVRSATQTDLDGHSGTGESAGVVDQQVIDVAATVLKNSFGKKASENPAGLAKRMSRTLQMSKEEWPPSLLRNMWDVLMDSEASRSLSAEHEARWINMLGYSLRPGFGVAMDDWRVMETWKGLNGKLNFTGPTALTEWWILWRRIAGGLPAGQQQALALPLITNFKDRLKKVQRAKELAAEAEEKETNKKHLSKRRKKQFRQHGNSHEASESWRLLGSFERLPLSMKIEIAELAFASLEETGSDAIAPALLWTLGRIGARQPFYGPLNLVVPVETVEDWIRQLMIPRKSTTERRFAAVLMSRKVGDRYRDIRPELRDRVVDWLTEHKSTQHFIELVQTGGELGSRENEMVFGESLPVGLKLSR